MGILDKVLGKDKEQDHEAPQSAREEIVTECPHTAMTPHWDSLDDMGKEALATYTCEACGRMFTHDQARPYLETPPAVLANPAPTTYDDESRSS